MVHQMAPVSIRTRAVVVVSATVCVKGALWVTKILKVRRQSWVIWVVLNVRARQRLGMYFHVKVPA